ALAVRVGGQPDVVGTARGLGDGLHVLFVLLDQVVAHGEAVRGVDRAFLGDQVAHMPVGGQDGEVLAEVFVDRLGLGWRFDDEQVLGHGGAGTKGDCGPSGTGTGSRARAARDADARRRAPGRAATLPYI